MPGNAALILPARPLSDTPRVTLLVLLALGRLISSREVRYSEAIPSETSFAFSSACAAPLKRQLVSALALEIVYSDLNGAKLTSLTIFPNFERS